jgi:cytochrome b
MKVFMRKVPASDSKLVARTVRVWDLPTRCFHWLLVVSVIGLVVTGNVGGEAMVWHFRFGYAVLSLLLFRVVWGLVGGYWSRFVQFIYSPKAIIAYLKGKGRATDNVGHNPLGAMSVFGLLGFLALQAGSGLFSDDEISNTGPLSRLVNGDWVSKLTWFHKEVGKTVIIIMVVLHVAAILFYLWKKKENLIRPMVQGDKVVSTTAEVVLENSRDTAGSRWAALALFLVCWVAVFGGLKWAS